LVGSDAAIALGIGLIEAVQHDDGVPVLILGLERLGHHRQLPGDVEQAGEALGALGVARHPEQVVGGSAQHFSFSLPIRVLRAPAYCSSTQVSLVPPPCEEFTTSEPSRSATRVSPPGTIWTPLPDSTKGRRSMWRGATPA